MTQKMTDCNPSTADGPRIGTQRNEPVLLPFPEEMERITTATLAARYFFLIEIKKAAQARLGNHHSGFDATKIEPDALVQEALRIGLKQIALELTAIMRELSNRKQNPEQFLDAVWHLLPDHAHNHDKPENESSVNST